MPAGNPWLGEQTSGGVVSVVTGGLSVQATQHSSINSAVSLFKRPMIQKLSSVDKSCRKLLQSDWRICNTAAFCILQIKLLKLLRVLGAGDKTASDNMSSVVHLALKRAAAGGNHTIGHAIVYEAVWTITEIYPNPQLLASAAESVAVLIKSNNHNLKYCGLNALAAITR